MVRWIPKITDMDERKGTKNLLPLAEKKLLEYNQHKKSVFSDSIGQYSFLTEDYIVVAKDYIFGWVVSCHEVAVLKARNLGKILLMYIKQAGKFYKFEPEEILKNGTINMRGGIRFINFDVRLGVDINKNFQRKFQDISELKTTTLKDFL